MMNDKTRDVNEFHVVAQQRNQSMIPPAANGTNNVAIIAEKTVNSIYPNIIKLGWA